MWQSAGPFVLESGECVPRLGSAGGQFGCGAGDRWGDLEDEGRGVGELGKAQTRILEVDRAHAGPEVFILEAVIVVDVAGGDAVAEGLDGIEDSDGDVRMAEVEADAEGVEVAYGEDVLEVDGGGGSAQQVLKQNADAERAGKGCEMLDGRQGMFDGLGGPLIVAFTEVENEVFEAQVLGRFEAALDLIHGCDAAAFVGMDDVDGRCTGTSALEVGIDGRMKRPEGGGVGTEPAGELVYVLAAGVVEVLAGGEDLNGFGAGAGNLIKQAGVQTLIEEDMR